MKCSFRIRGGNVYPQCCVLRLQGWMVVADISRTVRQLVYGSESIFVSELSSILN